MAFGDIILYLAKKNIHHQWKIFLSHTHTHTQILKIRRNIYVSKHIVFGGQRANME